MPGIKNYYLSKVAKQSCNLAPLGGGGGGKIASKLGQAWSEKVA